MISRTRVAWLGCIAPRQVLVAVGIAIGAASAKASLAQVPLDETMQWMTDFYRSHGGGVAVGAIWVDMTIDWAAACEIEVRSNLVPLNKSLYGMDSFYRARLSTLSPRLALVKGQVMTRVEAETGKPGSGISRLIRYGKGLSADEDVTSRLPFVFEQLEDAQRFARALEHAIRLCGGVESPF